MYASALHLILFLNISFATPFVSQALLAQCFPVTVPGSSSTADLSRIFCQNFSEIFCPDIRLNVLRDILPLDISRIFLSRQIPMGQYCPESLLPITSTLYTLQLRADYRFEAQCWSDIIWLHCSAQSKTSYCNNCSADTVVVGYVALHIGVKVHMGRTGQVRSSCCIESSRLFALPCQDQIISRPKLITRCIAAPTDSEVASFICRCCRCVLFCNVGYMAYIISRLSALSACLLLSGALVEILVLHFSWKWARTTVIRLVLRKCG